MADQRFEYYCDVVETGRFDRLHSNLNDLGGKGWRLVHVVPHPTSDPDDLLLVWERPLAPGPHEQGQDGGPDG